MARHVDVVFKDIESLLKSCWDDVEVDESCVKSTGGPQLVSLYQNILLKLDAENLHSLPPKYRWVSCLCRCLLEACEAMGDVVSVSHLAILRAAVSRVLSSVVLYHLPARLPYPMPAPSGSVPSLNVTQRWTCIELGLRCLLTVFDAETGGYHGRGSVTRYYGELLGSLICLDGKENISPQLREFCRLNITSLLDITPQTTVFTHLMILHNTEGDKGRVSRIVRKVLDTKLQREGGLAALLGATVLSDSAPSSTRDVTSLCTLITSQHPHSFYEAVFPQVLELLRRDERGKWDEVGAGCIATTWERDKQLCQTFMLTPLLSPLISCSVDGDIEITLRAIKAWVDAAPPSPPIQNILPHLCHLYASIHSSSSSVPLSVTDALLSCFKRLPTPCSYIDSWLFPPHPGVTYIISSSNYLATVPSNSNIQPLPYGPICQTIVKFISEKRLDRIKIDLYRWLLEASVDKNAALEKRLIITELLSDLSSDPIVLESLNRKPDLLIDFLIKLFTESPDKDVETVTFSLALLSVILTDDMVKKKMNWSVLSKLKPCLIRLKDSPVDEIKGLTVSIIKRLMDVGIIKDDSADETENVIHGEKGEVKECDYEEAVRDSYDEQLPVRAHALRSLAKLIQAKDQTTLTNKCTLLALFKINLNDSDSYLYLSAVEGLSSLASSLPDDVIPVLCSEFLSTTNKPELKLKIGQVIVRTISLIGEKGLAYKKELISCLLEGVKDSDPLIRASSLSNLGELLKTLSFRIPEHITEILYCAECVLDNDKEAEPRRAAVMLVSLLLQGLGKHTISVLRDGLLSLYRKLKEIYKEDKDEVARLHAQVALEHLSHSMRSILFDQSSPSDNQLSKLCFDLDT